MKAIAMILILIVLLGSLAYASAIAAETEEESRVTSLRKLIDRLKKLNEILRRKLEENKDKIGEDDYKRLIEELNAAKALLEKAEEALEEGDIETAKDLLRKAGEKYKGIVKEIWDLLDYDEKLRKLVASIKRCRRVIARLERIADRLEKLGVNVTEAELKLNEAKFYLDKAVEALKDKKFIKAAEYCHEAWASTKEAADLLKEATRKFSESKKDKILTAIDRIEDFLDRAAERVRNSNMSEEKKEVILNKIVEWKNLLETARDKVEEGKYREALAIIRRVLREIQIVLKHFKKH
ncbi:MAG: hypothetical protein DRJ38_10280 [Thermoprotei archaeon]|nr:MAG: hypothetical protein DRJ38_10280 [Thermoprotei archaeon]